jgi:hypothetical protein
MTTRVWGVNSSGCGHLTGVRGKAKNQGEERVGTRVFMLHSDIMSTAKSIELEHMRKAYQYRITTIMCNSPPYLIFGVKA